MRADRLLVAVQLLRRHGRLSASDLARRLEVSRRTVLRDMEALSAAGVPVYAERGRDGGFALVPGFEPDVEPLSEAETQAVFLAGGQHAAEMLGLGDSFTAALRKLATRLPDDDHRRVEHVRERIVLDAGSWLRDRVEPDALVEVQRAVLADERIRIRYQSRAASRPGTRTVDPWGMLQVGTTWYLIAAHRGRPRTYRIARIHDVTRLGEPCRRPPDLDLRQLWEQLREDFRSVPATEVVLRVHRPRLPVVLGQLRVTMLGEPSYVDDDPELVRVPVRNLDGAAAALAGFGDEVTVLAPPALRELIVQRAERAVAHHRGAP